MGPEILIVGDDEHQGRLAARVGGLGYDARDCPAAELQRRIHERTPPAAILVRIEGVDTPVLMAALRRTRQGAAVPVVLVGRFGDGIEGLADVLDLGADHFIEEPFDGDTLEAALVELAGPATGGGGERRGPAARGTTMAGRAHADEPPRPEPGAAARGGSSTDALRTEVLGQRSARATAHGDAPAAAGAGDDDPMFDQLYRTLDMLDARLQARLQPRDDRGGERHLDDEPGWAKDRGAEALRRAEADARDLPRTSPASDVVGAGAGGDVLAAAAATSRAGAGAVAEASDTGAGGSTVRLGRRPERAVERSAPSVDEPRGAPAAFPSPDDVTVGGLARDGRELDARARADGGASASRGDPRGAAGAGLAGDPAPEPGAQPWTSEHRPRGSASDALRGDLAEHELPRLLWRLHERRWSGRVIVSRARTEKQLWLHAGEVSFARSNLGEDRLVDTLLRRGLLTRAQYETARRLAAKEPRRAGQLLVEAGFLKPHELHEALRAHLRRVADSAFGWTDGQWTLEPDAHVEEPTVLEVPMTALLADGVRRRADESTLWGWIARGAGAGGQAAALASRSDREGRALAGGFSPRLRVPESERPGLARALELDAEQVRGLAAFDGHRRLGELAAPTGERGLAAADVLALVYVLRLLGAMELLGEPVPAPAPDLDVVALDRARIHDRLALARTADYFTLLGLGRDAVRADVLRASAELSATFADARLEPGAREGLGPALVELREAIAEARDLLLDDALRRAYLAHLDEP